ncbi:11945_t:CDS:1, partial [Funneliformis geosporum]
SIVNVNPINQALAEHKIKLSKIGADYTCRIYSGRNDSYCQSLRELACRQV